MEQNKTGRYLKYAIGEIILVVIGILIALQINNFNNHKQERKVEQDYLLSLKAEFETNLDKIDTSIVENNERIVALEGLLTLFNRTVRDTISNQPLSRMFSGVFGGELSYLPSRGVLSDIISSGKLNIISNKKLRQHLASFESNLDVLNHQLNDMSLNNDKLRDLLYQNGSVRNIVTDAGFLDFKHESISQKIDNKKLFDSVEFENYLLDNLLSAKATNSPRFYGGIRTEIETILLEIIKNLNI